MTVPLWVVVLPVLLTVAVAMWLTAGWLIERADVGMRRRYERKREELRALVDPETTP